MDDDSGAPPVATAFLIKRAGEESPARRFPIHHRWYSGMSDRGRGAVVQYQGWDTFALGDGSEVDMAGYAYLEEHEPRQAKT